jgi:hypothetical protein
VADALSRVGQFFQIYAVSSVVLVWVQEVINSYSVDPATQELIQALVVVSPDEKVYSLHDGLIRFKGKIWVGDNSALQTKIIQAFHSSPLGGQFGIQATAKRVQKHFCWKGIKTYVELFVQ